MEIKNNTLNRLKNHISYSLTPGRVNNCVENNNLELANRIVLDTKIDLKEKEVNG